MRFFASVEAAMSSARQVRESLAVVGLLSNEASLVIFKSGTAYGLTAQENLFKPVPDNSGAYRPMADILKARIVCVL